LPNSQSMIFYFGEKEWFSFMKKEGK